MNHPHPSVEDLFHPVEHAIIATWLDIEPVDQAQEIDIWTAAAPLDEEEQVDAAEQAFPPDRHIRLRHSLWKSLDQSAVDNAVARLLLQRVQARLPQWGSVSADGTVTLGRAIERPIPRRVELLPQFLFTINWANTAPGICWPESYHVAYLPYYHRYVVTASQDSPDAWGYCDRTIGHFDAEEEMLSGARDVVISEWRRQYEGWEQSRWEHLFDTGIVSSSEANEWADEVWEAVPELTV